MQALSTVVGGSVIGLIFVWKLALVAIACMPLLISTGYIRLVRPFFFGAECKLGLIRCSFPIACRCFERSRKQEVSRRISPARMRSRGFDPYCRLSHSRGRLLEALQRELGHPSEKEQQDSFVEQSAIRIQSILDFLRYRFGLLVRLQIGINLRV